jgi:acyl-CoA dehydrogenase
MAPPRADVVKGLHGTARDVWSAIMNYLLTPQPKDNTLRLPPSLAARIDAVTAIAASHADAVDREGRFPAEAIAALKDQKLMAVLVPEDFGGDGAPMLDAAELCYRLGRACGSAGMIYAMHLVKVACIVNHAQGNHWQEATLYRIAHEQLLLASSTTEGMGGGNVRASAAAIVNTDSGITLDRDASVISYGAYADGLVTTAKRAGGTDASDQVLAVFMKEDYDLQLTGGWDTLGMRGTCSTGFMLKARGLPDQVLPVPYARIHTQTMTPAAHILWSSVWAGVAAAAVTKAELFVRKVMRGSAGQLPPGAAHVGQAKSKLRVLRALLCDAVNRYEAAHRDDAVSASLEYQSAMALTKVEASELAVEIVMSCYRTCGLAGYRNDGDVSIGRHLRDVLSSPIMINNDRIGASMASAMLMSGVPSGLRA